MAMNAATQTVPGERELCTGAWIPYGELSPAGAQGWFSTGYRRRERDSSITVHEACAGFTEDAQRWWSAGARAYEHQHSIGSRP